MTHPSTDQNSAFGFGDLPKEERKELAALADRLVQCGCSVRPSERTRQEIRERVMAKIAAGRVSQVTYWHGLGLSEVWARFLAGGVLASFVFVAVGAFVWNPQDLRARDYNLLYVDGGEVYVERGGERMLAENEMRLLPGDTVTTSEDSRAEIQFVDYSVARLSEETKVEVVSSAKDGREADTQPIKLNVNTGKVWANTQTATTPKFELTTPHGTVEGDQATFGVEVSEKKTLVMVQENTATIDNKTITENQQATMSTPASGAQVVVQSTSKAENTWVNENILADTEHLAEVKQDVIDNIKKEAGALPGDSMYGVKQIGEMAAETFTLSDVDSMLLQVELAKNRLQEAVALFSQGDDDKAKEALRDFNKRLATIRKDLSKLDPTQAQTISKQLDQIAAVPNIRLLTTSLEEKSNPAHVALSSLGTQLAADREVKLLAELNETSKRLGDLSGLTLAEDPAQVAQLLQKYLDALNNVNLTDKAQLSVAVLAVLEQKQNDLVFLSTLRTRFAGNPEVVSLVLASQLKINGLMTFLYAAPAEVATTELKPAASEGPIIQDSAAAVNPVK